MLPGRANRILQTFVVLSLLGMAGLAATVVIGFEEPNAMMLWFSSVLLFAAPVALLVHLMVTKELSPQARRTWIREFTSARAGRALSAYLSSDDRGATAETFARRSAR
jgi:hypothetical protein